MTVKEIDALAKSKSAMPIDSTMIEAGLYTKLRQIYELFDYQQITVDEAKKQKTDLLEAFEYENGKDKQISELYDKILEGRYSESEQSKQQAQKAPSYDIQDIENKAYDKYRNI